MVRADADVDDAFAQAKGRGVEAAVWEAEVDAAAQLVLLTETPGKDAAFVDEGYGVVTASDDLGDVLQAGDKGRLTLHCRIRGEMQCAVVCLREKTN